MADSTLSNLQEATSILDTDLLYIVLPGEASSSDRSRKVTLLTLLNSLLAKTPTFTGAVLTVTAAGATAIADEVFMVCDATLGSQTMQLPSAADYSGVSKHFKKIDLTGNAVTLDADGTETIDGSGTISITSQYEAVTLVSDGSNWHIF